jgi:hypothetical protein
MTHSVRGCILFAVLAAGCGGRVEVHRAQGKTGRRSLAEIAADPYYVATPDGFYHTSCLDEVGDDEVVDEDGFVTRPDGTGYVLPTCEFDHYDYPSTDDGSAGTFSLRIAPHYSTPADDDGTIIEPKPKGGWLTSTWKSNSGGYSRFTADWYVPAKPSDDGALLFFFNGLEPKDPVRILQPVLAYGYNGAHKWQIGVWSCGGDDDRTCPHTGLRDVDVGDHIVGTMEGKSCSNGVCNWTITITDTTNGKRASMGWAASHRYITAITAFEAYSYADNCNKLPDQSSLTFWGTIIDLAGGGGRSGEYWNPRGGGACSPYATSPDDGSTTLHWSH